MPFFAGKALLCVVIAFQPFSGPLVFLLNGSSSFAPFVRILAVPSSSRGLPLLFPSDYPPLISKCVPTCVNVTAETEYLLREGSVCVINFATIAYSHQSPCIYIRKYVGSACLAAAELY